MDKVYLTIIVNFGEIIIIKKINPSDYYKRVAAKILSEKGFDLSDPHKEVKYEIFINTTKPKLNIEL